MKEKISAYLFSLLPNSPTKKRLYENFISLSLLRGITYLFPLFTLPYLVRVLGPEKYGLVAFAQAFANYFNILTDYGFNMSATREISIEREDKNKVSQIFSSVLSIKFLLFILSLIIFTTIVFFIPRFAADKAVYFFSFLLVLGNTLFPIWFFQGMEKMKYITFISTLAKVFFLVCVFVFIKRPDQYALVPLFGSLGSLISGLVALILVFRSFKIRFIIPSLKEMKTQLINGWHFFTASFFTTIYTSSNTFFIGLVTGNNELVGYFAGAEKIVAAFRGLLSPISQTVYPYFSKLFYESKEKSLEILKKMGLIIGSFSLAISIIMFVLAPFISRIILGEEFSASTPLIRIMSFVPFIISLSNIFAIQGLLGLGKSKTVSKIIVFASIVHLPVFVLLTLFFSIRGAATAIVITESLVTGLSIYNFNKICNTKKRLFSL